MKHINQHIHFNQYFSWSIAAVIYSLSFFIKISPNTLQTVLQADLNLSFQELGVLSAAFYYSYGTFQIIGTLLSLRFGLLRVFWCYLFFFICGLAIFVTATNYPLAMMGRVLMGLGSSLDFAFCLFLARSFFPKKSFAFFIGVSNLFGVLGGWFAQYPLELVITAVSWRFVFLSILIVLPILATFLFLSLRQCPHFLSQPMNISFAMNEVLSHKKKLLMMLFICFSMVLPILMIPEMWGSLFLETLYQISSLEASAILSYFFVGIGLGNASLGFLSKRFKALPLIRMALLCELLSCGLFIYGSSFIPAALLPLIALLIGISASVLLLFFDIVNQTFTDPRLALPALNIFMTLLSASSHPFIGWYLDKKIGSSLSLSQALLQSFSIAPFFLSLSLGLILFTNARNSHDNFIH